VQIGQRARLRLVRRAARRRRRADGALGPHLINEEEEEEMQYSEMSQSGIIYRLMKSMTMTPK
jgi:hypothetical protein